MPSHLYHLSAKLTEGSTYECVKSGVYIEPKLGIKKAQYKSLKHKKV